MTHLRTTPNHVRSRELVRGLIVLLLAVIISLNVGMLHAQSGVETFTLAGQTHVIQYRSLSTRVQEVRSSIETTVPVYLSLFDTTSAPLSFQIIILTD